MRHIKPLSPVEKTTLEEGSRNSKKHHFRTRCQSILMSAEGYKVPDIAKLFKVRTRTIYTWFDRWEQMGIAGLMIFSGRGVKAKLNSSDEQQVAEIRAAIKVNPQSLKQVCEALSKTLGFKITPDMLKRFIKKNSTTVGDDFANA